MRLPCSLSPWLIDILRIMVRQATADDCYASKENLETAKQRNINDIAFHKKSGLEMFDMVKSPWHIKFRNFRAGIEACIS